MDYNDFYMKSLQSGAQPDSFGNIHHTPASMATFAMNEDHERFVNESRQDRLSSYSGHPTLDAKRNFWEWLFDGK